MGWRQRGVSLRQFRVWQAWLDLEQEDSLEHVHQMQVAAEVRRILAFLGGMGNNPKPVRLEDFRIKFTRSPRRAGSPREKTDQARSEHQSPDEVNRPQQNRMRPASPDSVEAKVAKMKWFSALGGAVTVDNRDGTYTLPSGRRITERELNEKGTREVE